MPDNDLLTERQAARYLALKLDLLRHEVNQGRLRKRHENWYRRADLDEWQSLGRARRAMPDMDLTGVPRTMRALVRRQK